MHETRTFRFEMALTFDELRRYAPHLVEGAALDLEDRAVSGAGAAPGESWSIALGAPRERAIALIRIALTDVVLTLSGYDDAGAARFLERFHRVFQKGGG